MSLIDWSVHHLAKNPADDHNYRQEKAIVGLGERSHKLLFDH
jgi:hypothetical protein